MATSCAFRDAIASAVAGKIIGTPNASVSVWIFSAVGRKLRSYSAKDRSMSPPAATNASCSAVRPAHARRR